MLQFAILIITAFYYMIPFLSFLPFKLAKRKKICLFLLIFSNICVMAYMIGQIGVILLLTSVSIYVAFLNKHRLRNICTFFISYIFIVMWDHVFSLVWNLLICDIELLFHNVTFEFIYNLSSTLLICIPCFLLHLLLKRNNLLNKISLLSKKLLALITVNLLICVVIFVFNIVMGEHIGYTTQTIRFNCILFGVYFFISSALIIRLIKSYLTENELRHKQKSYEQLQEYTEQIENMYSSIRAFKHDYANIMLSLSGYIDNQDMSGLKNYYYNEIVPLSNHVSNNNFKLNQLMNIELPEVKGLIAAKLTYAHELGIAVNIEVSTQIKSISIDILDFSRILGIFLDNAIEAALETEHPELTFVIFTGDTTSIIITNTFVEHGIPISSLKRANVSSKGECRGIGLNNASTILSKYTNVLLDTEVKNGYFIQHLEIT